MPNRLAAERSPYLLQHANNPVDWYPWNEEAFERARREDKPIFLSIGYSTCHWCHVMEHESFESPEIAAALNEGFVSIKLDREERPDVDRVYMTFVQATTGAGGWPMSVFLTPDLEPFYGGTYFPPESRWGRPGFIDLLRELTKAWRSDRARVDSIAHTLADRLREATTAQGTPGNVVPGAEILEEGVEQFRRTFDRQFGGFGTAPKFPRPSELLFLLREHARRRIAGSVLEAAGHETASVSMEMATATLRAMAFGGMRDHVGGGFHRYSVDRAWRVPHFEKMLYDQAQLALAYLEAAQATGDAFFAVVAEDTLEYVRRDMTDERGGFFSAEDADSVPPDQAASPGARKSEGAFYLWSAEEIDRLLGPDSEIVKLRFGILPQGNAPEDPHGEFTGQNLLYTAATIEEVASRAGRAPEDVVAVLGRARQAMFHARARRPKPQLDDKVLTAWNGLMIAAFARAGRQSPDRAPLYLETARRAASFLRDTLWDENRRVLRRRYRGGESAIDGYCEDYAYLIWGLLELFQSDGDARWLSWALDLQSRQDALFWDDAGGGWYSTTGADPTVLLRLKEDYDGAEPAASSVAAMNLIALAHLIGRDDHRQRAASALARLTGHGSDGPRVAPFMAAALSAWHAGFGQVVIVGDPGREDTRGLRQVVASRYLPFTLLVPIRPGSSRAEVSRWLPFTAELGEREGRATAYVCQNFTCDAPTSDPEVLGSQLDGQDGHA